MRFNHFLPEKRGSEGEESSESITNLNNPLDYNSQYVLPLPKYLLFLKVNVHYLTYEKMFPCLSGKRWVNIIYLSLETTGGGGNQ